MSSVSINKRKYYYMTSYFRCIELVTFVLCTLTNAKGQLMKTITISNKGAGQVSINTATFAAGTYNYTLWVNGRQTDTKRLIITK